MNFFKNIKTDILTKLFIFILSFIFVFGNIAFYLINKNGSNAILMILVDLPLLIIAGFIFKIKDDSIVKEKFNIIYKALICVSDKSKLPMDINLFKDDSLLYDNLEVIKKLHDDMNKNDENFQNIIKTMDLMSSDMELENLFENIMPSLLITADSTGGVFYQANNTAGKLELCFSVGFNKNIYTEFDINIGEGLIGVASTSREITIISNIPEDTIFVTKTFLGKIVPRSIMMVPIINNDILLGILCLASLKEFTSECISSIDMMRHFIGITVSNCLVHTRTKRMAKELKFQNSLIQGLNEELESKVNDKDLFLKNIINSLKDFAIYICDVNGIIREWNKSAENIYGYKAEDIIGKHVNILFSDINEAKIAKVIKEKGSYDYRTKKIKADGTIYFLETKIYGSYNEFDELIGTTNVTREVEADLTVE